MVQGINIKMIPI